MNTTSIQDLVRRNPLAFSALVAGTVLAVNLVLKLGSIALSLELSILTTGGLSAALLSAVGALAITRLGLWHELGLLGWPARLRTLAWFLPFVALGVLPWITVSHLTPRTAPRGTSRTRRATAAKTTTVATHKKTSSKKLNDTPGALRRGRCSSLDGAGGPDKRQCLPSGRLRRYGQGSPDRAQDCLNHSLHLQFGSVDYLGWVRHLGMA